MPDSTNLLIPPLGRLYALFAPITLPLIRLMAGGSLAFHGYQIVFGNIEGAGRFFESVGFENGLMWAWVVGLLELVCGTLLAIGLFTRLAAGPIIVFLIVAIITYHWEFGYNWESRGIEYPLFWMLVVQSTIGLLPDRIRREYGFAPLPPAPVRKALVAGGAEYVKRAVIPFVPERLRFVPAARAA